jgi:hypothetical protein
MHKRLLPLLLLLATSGCLSPCQNEVVREELSPNGTHKAVYFLRTCGALAKYKGFVSILPASSSISAGDCAVLTLDDTSTVLQVHHHFRLWG